MFKNILLLFSFICLSVNTAFARETLVKISPVYIFSTCKENVMEGDTLKFKVIEKSGDIEKGEVIIGKILKYQPNGFSGQEAQVTIGDFKKENNENIAGELYLTGSNHKVYQEYMNGSISISPIPIPFIRGGEIKLTPEDTVSFFTKITDNNNEKVSVKIVPTKAISTAKDETEINDKLHFKTIDDTYYKNKLYIKKDTPVIGIVDFVEENGWQYDNAHIIIKKFKTRDINDNVININSTLNISSFELLKTKGNRKAQFFNYMGVIFRGKEIDIKPGVDNPVFVIWVIK